MNIKDICNLYMVSILMCLLVRRMKEPSLLSLKRREATCL